MTETDRLRDRFRRIAVLDEAVGMLHWDAAAVMPDGGADARAEQLATLRELAHGLLVAPETADLLDAAAATDGGDPAPLALMRRRWRRDQKRGIKGHQGQNEEQQKNKMTHTVSPIIQVAQGFIDAREFVAATDFTWDRPCCHLPMEV